MTRMRTTRSPRHAQRAAGSASARAARAVSVLASVVAVALVVLPALPAQAYWSSTGIASRDTATATLAAPTEVTVPASAEASVAVSWAAGEGGVAAQGYYVTRTDRAVSAPACGSSPTSLITTLSCTDLEVAAGSYSYTVVAVFRSWTASSAASSLVAVSGTRSPLGAAQSFSILSPEAVTSTGVSSVSGDLGVGPGLALTGFPPSIVSGDIHIDDPAATAALEAFATAYAQLDALVATKRLAGDLAGTTLTPGVYHAAGALSMTGTLTLDAQGDPDAQFIINVDAALNTAAASRVELINGADPSNVWWVVLGAAGTGGASSFSGTILARGAITVGAAGVLIGRAFSFGAITLADNVIRFTDALPPTLSIDGGSAAIAKTATPTLTGTSSASQNSPVRVTIDGQILTTSLTSTGTWSITTPELSAGVHTVAVQVRDAAGNATKAVQELTVQLNPAAVDLGAATTYSVLAVQTVANTGTSRLSADLGVSPGTTVTGFPPGIFSGTLHAGDPAAAAAQADLLSALTKASGRTADTKFDGVLTGRTFTRGIHHTIAAANLTGTVTFDAEGDPGAIFIIQIDGALATAASSAVLLVNGASADNIFWVVAGAAGTGANASFAGTIMAVGAITLGEGSQLDGRALSRDTVTLSTTTVSGVVGAQP